MFKRLLLAVALGAALIGCTPASPAGTTAPSVGAPTEAPSVGAPSESAPTESAAPSAS